MPKIKRTSDKKSLRWLFKQARPARHWISISVGLGLAGGLLLVAQAGFLANLIHSFFIAGLPRDVMLPSFVGLVAVVLLRAAVAWSREVSS